MAAKTSRAGGDGGIDVRGGVGGAEEGGLELRGRKPDAGVEHAAMETAEEFRVTGCGAIPVEDLVIGEEPGEHAANLVGGDGDSGVMRSAGDAGDQVGCEGIKAGIDGAAAGAQDLEHGQSGGHGEGISAEGSGLVDGAKRRDLVHQRGRSAVGADGESTTNHLA